MQDIYIILHQKNTIVNYDNENGWSSIFDNIGKDKIAYATESDKAILNDIKDRIKLESQLANNVEWDTYINGHQNASESLKSFLKDTDYAEKSLTNYNSYLEKTGKTTSKFSAISDKATSVVKSIGSVAANMVVGAGVGLAISAVIDGITYLATYNERMAESARTITSAWDESNSSLNEQISKYKELKSQLDSGTLTPDEEYSTRQQILDIQTQITSQYGEQAEGVSLVNGNLEQQLAILQNIAAENAKTELNKGMGEYKNVAQQMEKERSYLIGATSFIDENAYAKDIYNLAKEYEDLGISIKDVSEAGGLEDGTSFEIYFDGDATQADKVVSDFMNRVSELKDKYRDDVGAISFIDDSNSYASSALKKNQEILDDYQESYNKFLQMDMMSRGTGEGSVADTYNKYAEAVQAYNEALASGDSDAISKARADFNELSGEVDTLLSKGDNDKFTVLFDEITDSLDDASIKLNDFNEALNGKAGDTNTFKDQAENIKNASDALKAMKLDAVDALNALETAGEQDGENELWTLAYNWGITSKSSAEDMKAFVDILSEAGIVTGTVASATDAAAESYESYSSAVQSATENLATLQSIMSESVSGAGISADNVQAFRDMFGDDAKKALEKTANGYHLNVDALRELQAQQETLTKSDYLTALSDQYELLYENSEKLAKAQFMGNTDDITALEATRQGILDQISSLQDLQYQYESATSAYQDWINAQSNGNERDMYDNIQSGYATVTDLIERGWGGSDEVRTYVDLLSSADLSTASVDEVIDAYNRLGQTIGNSGYSILDFFTVDEDGNTTTDGIYNFFDTVNSVLGEEFAKINENGDYEFNFGDGRDQTVADALGMDVEAVQSILRAASEAGFEINLDQPIESLEELKTSAQTAQEALANMQDSSLADINLDSTSFSEITDDISQVEDYIDKINSDSTLEPDVKTEKLENANAILEYLVEMQNEAGNNSIEISVNSEELEQKISDAKTALDAFKNDDGQVDLSIEGAQEAVDNLQTLLSQKEQLNTPTVMTVDTSKVDGELGDAIAKIQEYQSAVQDLAVQTELKTQGVDIDTSAAQEKVNNLASEIQNINPDITAKLNIDTSSTATIQSSIQALTPEILVKAGVDESAIVAFTSEEKQAQGKVTWTNNTMAVDFYASTQKTANGVVTWTNNTENVRTHFTATGSITWSGSGGNAPHQGTAHANGSTVKSYRFNWNGQANASGNWGIKNGGTSLVGELGQEILVRGSKFYTIGDNGAEFIQTRPGDIIFNHKQAESLLKNGYVTSRGRMIGGNANVDGSAYSSGSGGLGRPSRPSYGMDDSYASNNSSKKSDTSTKKAAEATQQAAESVSEAADEFEESFDQIEILLDRMDRSLQKLTDSIETYSYDLSKQSSVSDQAMNQIRSNLTTLQQAYNRYIQEANSVGLSDDWKRRVENGAIDVTTLTDENLADQISEYQKWYEKSLDVQDTIADYQSQLLDLATEKLDNIEQYFENRTNYNDEFGYLTDISTLQDAVNKLTAELDKQVLAGVIKEGSNEFYSAMSQVAEAQDALIEATLKKYQDIIDNLDRISTTLDNSLELKEARGDQITEEDYQRSLELANEQIDELYKKREQLLKQQAIYDVGSAKYDEYADQIADVDDEIYGLLGDIEDLKDKIWEVRWQPFFDGMEAAENLRNEMDEFRKSLSEDSLISETGGLTENGITSVALISAAMNNAKQQIKDYSTALEKLEQDLEAGNISTSEFEEQQLEFLQAIRDSSGEVADYQNTLIDMYTTMLERENDVMQDSISKQKELLDWRKKNADYAKSIRNQTKEINQIQAQINALSGSTNQSSIAERKRLEAQLAELQEELQSSQQDREYDVRSQGYDSLSDDLNEALQSTLDEITYNADKQEEVVSNMLQNIVGQYETAYNKINQIIANTGIVPSDQFQQVIDNLGSQSGAESQVNDSNTIAPNYNPSDFTNINTGQIQSGSNQSHNDFIESEIKKEPNIDNRPVAQITLKPTSISVEEGKSATISANIRPTDAANKSVEWRSSNTAVATVSNGVVKGVKPGSAQITCAALDGSGVSATAGVTVTEKPKPAPAPSPSGGGDGVPRVGDVVTFTGSYFYDSWGKRPAGSRYSGVAGGVVIDAYSSKKYGGSGNRTGGYDVHIKSADGRYGDLGWVSLNQISGYATGTKGITNPVEIARVDEMGKELRIKRGGDIYEMFRYGDAVVPKHMTDNLFTLADHTNEIMETINGVDRNGGEITINNNYDSLLHVDGNVDKDALPGLQELLFKSYQYTSKQMKRDATLQGIRRTL